MVGVACSQLLLLLSLLAGLAFGFQPHASTRVGFVSQLSKTTSTRLSATPAIDEWRASKVIRSKADGEGLRTIEMEVDEAIAKQYVHPGQYVKIKVGDSKPSFFAIASPPDERSILTFLVKESPNNDFILKAKDGDKLDLSTPMGKGFQIDEYFNKYKNDFPTNNILMMACGSGIAPIAAAIESKKLGLKSAGYTTLYERQARLYIGARTPKHLPLQSRYSEWESMGVKVIPVISRTGEATSVNWTGRTGYIQDALREDSVPTPRNCAALLCGMRDMTDNVKEMLLEAGVFEGRILFNF